MSFYNTVLPVILSLVTSLIVVYFKSVREAKAYKEKLDSDHKLSEIKKIKESISRYKVHVLNSAEELNHRLWNLSREYQRNWHQVDGKYYEKDKYYYHSFIYRFIALVWWANEVDKKLVYLDTTLAEKNDMEFLKFCRYLNILLCQTQIYRGIGYNDEHDIDHFFRHRLINQSSSLSDKDGQLIDYSSFEENVSKYIPKVEGVCQFLDGVNPDEERLRWGKLYCLQLLIVALLNTYGYDFQYTNPEKIKMILDTVKKHKHGDVILKNFCSLVEEYKLTDNSHMNLICRDINA